MIAKKQIINEAKSVIKNFKKTGIAKGTNKPGINATMGKCMVYTQYDASRIFIKISHKKSNETKDEQCPERCR